MKIYPLSILNWLLSIIVWMKIIRLSLRWIFSTNIGDEVWYRGEKWDLIQGVCDPSWDLMNKKGVRINHIHKSNFEKVKTLKNYFRSFKSGYHFYMGYWFKIWVREGIAPWMKECNIWKGNPISLFPLAFLFFVGCATTEPRQVVQNALPYIPAVTAAIGTATLALAVDDPVERKQISDELYAVAMGVRSLMGGVAPTAAQLQAAVTSFGGGKSRYAGLGASLAGVWSGFYPQVARGDVKLAFDVLAAISDGIETVAKNFGAGVPVADQGQNSVVSVVQAQGLAPVWTGNVFGRCPKCGDSLVPVGISCPEKKDGCAVFHFRKTCNRCEAAM